MEHIDTHHGILHHALLNRLSLAMLSALSLSIKGDESKPIKILQGKLAYILNSI
jgi:hypothetical protein